MSECHDPQKIKLIVAFGGPNFEDCRERILSVLGDVVKEEETICYQGLRHLDDLIRPCEGVKAFPSLQMIVIDRSAEADYNLGEFMEDLIKINEIKSIPIVTIDFHPDYVAGIGLNYRRVIIAHSCHSLHYLPNYLPTKLAA